MEELLNFVDNSKLKYFLISKEIFKEEELNENIVNSIFKLIDFLNNNFDELEDEVRSQLIYNLEPEVRSQLKYDLEYELREEIEEEIREEIRDEIINKD